MNRRTRPRARKARRCSPRMIERYADAEYLPVLLLRPPGPRSRQRCSLVPEGAAGKLPRQAKRDDAKVVLPPSRTCCACARELGLENLLRAPGTAARAQRAAAHTRPVRPGLRQRGDAPRRLASTTSVCASPLLRRCSHHRPGRLQRQGEEAGRDRSTPTARASGWPFTVKVNAGGLLAGAPRGRAVRWRRDRRAFTGATKGAGSAASRAADGGTLFLGTRGSINLSLKGQMKLLRVLQTGNASSSTSAAPAPRRSTSASSLGHASANLRRMIAQGVLSREDLPLFRLNVIEDRIPPLLRAADVLRAHAEGLLHHDIERSAQRRRDAHGSATKSGAAPARLAWQRARVAEPDPARHLAYRQAAGRPASTGLTTGAGRGRHRHPARPPRVGRQTGWPASSTTRRSGRAAFDHRRHRDPPAA